MYNLMIGRKILILTLVALCCFIMIMNQAVFVRANVLDGRSRSSRVVYLLVASDIYEPLKPYLERWMDDVRQEGYQPKLKVITDETPPQIRQLLKETPNLVGCLMVGDIPAAWFELNDTLDDEIRHYEFPCDFYYMDLNGIWIDHDNDGIYDEHVGDRYPEIFVGRLKTSTLSKSKEEEIKMLKIYFNKNHLYRMGAFTLPHRALIYLDSDLVGIDKVKCIMQDGSALCSLVAIVYKEREFIYDQRETCAHDFFQRIMEGWSMVHLVVHGSETADHFKVNGEWYDMITSSEVRASNPKVFFYFLDACLNARYTSRDYLAGCYVFSNYGLLAVGGSNVWGWWSLKWYRTAFYNHLRYGFGEATRQWIINAINTRVIIRHYYGTTIIGDPFLKPIDNGPDSDGDCLADWFELENGLDLSNPDCDSDGLDDYVELVIYETNPLKVDSDDDGLSDPVEIELGTDPLDSDADDDGLSDSEEVRIGTDVNNADSDYDKLLDGEEVQIGTDPLDSDTDDDGLLDKKEVELELDPTDPDMDDDGLNDCQEILLNLDPKNPDIDGDGLLDGEEIIIKGTDPRRVDTDGDFWNDKVDPAPTLSIIPNLFILALILVVVAVFLIKG